MLKTPKDHPADDLSPRKSRCSTIGTVWDGNDIWLRREIELPEEALNNLWLVIHHDEDAEVYINGVLARRLNGYSTQYYRVPISSEALATLKSGKSWIAIHCHQSIGGQYIDAGLVFER